MDHWEVVSLQPGFYSVSHGSSADVRQAAIPLTPAAEHVARAHDTEAEMFPFADQGDMTPIRVVLIEDDGDLNVLEYDAMMIHEQLFEETAQLYRELVPA